jgi:hypothetical protein
VGFNTECSVPSSSQIVHVIHFSSTFSPLSAWHFLLVQIVDIVSRPCIEQPCRPRPHLQAVKSASLQSVG